MDRGGSVLDPFWLLLRNVCLPEPESGVSVLILRSGYAGGRQNTGDDLTEGLHEDEEQYRINAQGNDTFYQTNGKEVFPFHAVHEMEP